MIETAVRLTAAASWAGIAFLVLILWRIARFYEKSANQRAYSGLFLPPLFLLPLGALYYLLLDVDFVGSWLPDLLFVLGGISLSAGTFLLGRVMAGEK